MTHNSTAYRLSRLRQHLQPEFNRSPASVAAELNATSAALPSRHKVCNVDRAVASIPDNCWITVSGFVATGCPDYLLAALRARFDSTAHPSGLKLILPISSGDRAGRGLDRLAVPGLLSKMVYAWTGTSPALIKLVTSNQVQAWNLPVGAISHMIRDAAAGRAGPVTRIGLGTFVDPREQGGKLNEATKEDIVEVVTMGGREALYYRVQGPIHVALLRASTADLDGNCSFEHEPLYCDALSQAMAAHNAGGIVIVQVQRVVERGHLPTRSVHIPAVMVDKIVVAPPEYSEQIFGKGAYDGSLNGEVRSPASATSPLPLDQRKVMAHRALLEIAKPHSLVNLGVGAPEGIGTLVVTHAHVNPAAATAILSTEAGIFGGVPQMGLGFGTARNPRAIVPTATMLDFYNGGGIDVTFLGMAEVDGEGNVNVSRFGDRMPGCGGFIDISQSARKVVFMGTFTTGGLKVSIQGGRLSIDAEGKQTKFRRRVQEKTFAASSAGAREVLYVTERAVFRLLPGGAGLELCEVAPGVDVERDVVAHMEVRPRLAQQVEVMAAGIFQP